MSDLRTQLQAIYDQHQKLTPQIVVDTARDEAHPLHLQFEWDDQVAGEKYRLEQARRMIRSVRVTYREATEQEGARTMRAFHSVRTPDGNVYKPTDEIVESPILTKLLMQDMEREWLQLKRKYAQFEEFLKMVRADVEQEAA